MESPADSGPRPSHGISIFMLKELLLFLAFSSLGGCTIVNHMIFQPPPLDYQDGPQILKVSILGSDEVISARFMPNPAAHVVLLYSHGNGDDLGSIETELDDFRAHDFAVFSYDYEGYGTSSGRPSEQSVYRDAEAAYAYLTEVLAVSPRRIVLYGFSLGSGPSVYLATHHHVRALVLESAFVSAFRVRTQLPLGAFDQFDNLSRLRRVGCPILILHSRDDPVIDFWHAEALHAAAPNRSKIVLFESGGHGDARLSEGARYWAALTTFTGTRTN